MVAGRLEPQTFLLVRQERTDLSGQPRTVTAGQGRHADVSEPSRSTAARDDARWPAPCETQPHAANSMRNGCRVKREHRTSNSSEPRSQSAVPSVPATSLGNCSSAFVNGRCRTRVRRHFTSPDPSRWANSGKMSGWMTSKGPPCVTCHRCFPSAGGRSIAPVTGWSSTVPGRWVSAR